MSKDYTDDADYPTKDDIQRLTEWGDPDGQSATPQFDANGAIDFMRSLWWMPEWGIREDFTPEERMVYGLDDDYRYVQMSTGGWSGNEELMMAFQERWWRQQSIVVHRRGGHYILEYRREKTV